jgi:hypothetical protein
MFITTVGYDAGREKARTDQKAQEDRKGIEVFHMEKRDWRGLSYIRLFLPIIPEEEYAYDQVCHSLSCSLLLLSYYAL